MKRRDFIKGSLAAGIGLQGSSWTQATAHTCVPAATAATVQPAPATRQPHIILIMTDQLRGDALHCMGNEAVISPHIDQLAQEGTLFTSGYTSAPSSTPARAGLLTGMSPWHHGMLGYGRVARKYPYEMPQMLRDLGYYTFGIGKMHWFPQKYWCALTDGKIKYIWFMHTGEEQLFDLVKDPGEERNVAQAKPYQKQLAEMRQAMVRHLSERGDGFVKDGQLVKREQTLLYSPYYPQSGS